MLWAEPAPLDARLDTGDRRGTSRDWLFAEHAGEADLEGRSALIAVVADDFAVVLLDDAVGGAESQPCTPDALGGVEGIEHALGLLQSHAGIGEFDDYFVFLGAGHDPQHAAALRFHGIH